MTKDASTKDASTKDVSTKDVSTKDVSIEVRSGFGPEVMEGLELYNRLTADPRDVAVARAEWPYWFTENPFGSGAFAIARTTERVVGLYTLIPTEIRVAGRSMVAGKGEFLVVEPAYRKVVSENGMPIPVALVAALNHRIQEFKMEGTLAVPTPAAAVCSMLSGARPMRYEATEFVTFFRRPRRSLHANPIRDLAMGWGAAGYTSLRRMLASRRAGDATIEVFDDLREIVQRSDSRADLLVNESLEMLSYRFAGDRHWKYRVTEPGREPAFYIFTTFPDDVRLAHWTVPQPSPRGLLSLALHVAARARKTGVSNLRIQMPTDALPEGLDLTSAGFVRRTLQHDVYLYGHDDLMQARSGKKWRFTNSHAGYY